MVHHSLVSTLNVILLATAFLTSTSSISAVQPQGNSLPPKLAWPIDCELDKTCWIARYMDRKAGPEKADYLCKAQTEDKHNGTDIVIPDLARMRAGVDVRAAADGRVLALRNGMPDEAVTKERRAAIMKKGCGNVIILGHGGGWQTRYCHLKNGSLSVKKGDTVKTGQIIAQVGLSGLTEYPHLHFMVQQYQKDHPTLSVDPFDGGTFEGGCDAPSNHTDRSLWREPIEYAGPIVMPPLLTSAPVTRQDLWNAQTPELPADAPMLRIQARGFHTLPNDIWRFSLIGPDGRLKFTYDVRQRNQRQLVGANAHQNAPDTGFMTGDWTAKVILLRDNIVVGSAQSIVRIVPN